MEGIIRNQIIDKHLWDTHILLNLWISPEIVVYSFETKSKEVYYKALKIDRTGGGINVVRLSNNIWGTYDTAYIHGVSVVNKAEGMFSAVEKLILAKAKGESK